MTLDLGEAQQTFIAESRELLQAMEAELLQLEPGSVSRDAVNTMFRAAHTIKGSAGLFGFDGIVSFTHVVENVLDRMRDGKLEAVSELVTLLLSCADHISRLIDGVADVSNEPDAEAKSAGEQLLQKLRAYLGAEGSAAKSPAAGAPAQQQAQAAAEEGSTAETNNWHISLRFGQDVLRNGMDPLSFMRYLGTLGSIARLETLWDAMPQAHEMDPEACYLGFEVAFRSDASKEAIASVFEFVQDDSRIRILPPRSRVSEYIQLFDGLADRSSRLGEILVNCGTLTRHELEAALAMQADEATVAAAGEGGNVRPLGEILVEQKMVHKPVVEAAVEKQKEARKTKEQENRFIRVQADKLDNLINLVGELVVAGDGAGLHARRLKDEELLEASSLISRLVSEIRDSALQLRMVQIAETFNRFHRVVHDVSRELGKEIELAVSGKETELDKSVVEKIGDPLMHLVRNAMDHGIEPAEARQAAGKPAKGTVRLNACHDSGSIVIEVSDDGGGLNREKILAKAVERGLVGPTQNLSDQEVYKLIFEAGFSTAEQVTNLSGRGVGMDVVRRNIEALRGTIEIDSQEGVGTVIRIRLPLTLAIIDGFLIGVNGASYVVPLDSVVECIEHAEQQLGHGRNYINLRGGVLPFLRLREQFEVSGALSRRENIVVVQYAGKKAGLVVDELMGEFQTVIKPLGKLFGNLQGISGSTILGSGDVALILDVPSLVQQAASAEAQAAASARQQRHLELVR